MRKRQCIHHFRQVLSLLITVGILPILYTYSILLIDSGHLTIVYGSDERDKLTSTHYIQKIEILQYA